LAGLLSLAGLLTRLLAGLLTWLALATGDPCDATSAAASRFIERLAGILHGITGHDEVILAVFFECLLRLGVTGLGDSDERLGRLLLKLLPLNILAAGKLLGELLHVAGGLVELLLALALGGRGEHFQVPRGNPDMPGG